MCYFWIYKIWHLLFFGNERFILLFSDCFSLGKIGFVVWLLCALSQSIIDYGILLLFLLLLLLVSILLLGKSSFAGARFWFFQILELSQDHGVPLVVGVLGLIILIALSGFWLNYELWLLIWLWVHHTKRVFSHVFQVFFAFISRFWSWTILVV